jgi:hypothetical protein
MKKLALISAAAILLLGTGSASAHELTSLDGSAHTAAAIDHHTTASVDLADSEDNNNWETDADLDTEADWETDASFDSDFDDTSEDQAIGESDNNIFINTSPSVSANVDARSSNSTSSRHSASYSRFSRSAVSSPTIQSNSQTDTQIENVDNTYFNGDINSKENINIRMGATPSSGRRSVSF